MVNRCLMSTRARATVTSAVREERLLGVKRVPQRDFGIPVLPTTRGYFSFYGNPPARPHDARRQ